MRVLGKMRETGTFTHSSLTSFIKTYRKVTKSSNLFYKVLSTGTNIINIWLSLCHGGCVRFAKYCGKMNRCHIFFPTVDYFPTFK